MKSKIKNFILGFLVATLIFSLALPVLARDGQETWTVIFRNIKLVVDGVLIEPKDAMGNTVDPFIYNGTTYLPVRAVAEAFGKEVTWDGNTSTIYLGDPVDKPAKEVTLFNRSYIECSDPGNFKSYEERGISYVGFTQPVHVGTETSQGRWTRSSSVVYPLNGVAKTFNGTLLPSKNEYGSPETVYKIYDESRKMLYQSPIMLHSTTPIDIEVNISNALSFKIEITTTSGWANHELLIQNPAIITSDYVE